MERAWCELGQWDLHWDGVCRCASSVWIGFNREPMQHDSTRTHSVPQLSWVPKRCKTFDGGSPVENVVSGADYVGAQAVFRLDSTVSVCNLKHTSA